MCLLRITKPPYIEQATSHRGLVIRGRCYQHSRVSCIFKSHFHNNENPIEYPTNKKKCFSFWLLLPLGIARFPRYAATLKKCVSSASNHANDLNSAWIIIIHSIIFYFYFVNVIAMLTCSKHDPITHQQHSGFETFHSNNSSLIRNDSDSYFMHAHEVAQWIRSPESSHELNFRNIRKNGATEYLAHRFQCLFFRLSHTRTRVLPFRHSESTVGANWNIAQIAKQQFINLWEPLWNNRQ